MAAHFTLDIHPESLRSASIAIGITTVASGEYDPKALVVFLGAPLMLVVTGMG